MDANGKSNGRPIRRDTYAAPTLNKVSAEELKRLLEPHAERGDQQADELLNFLSSIHLT
jgi:hypothetical protein